MRTYVRIRPADEGCDDGFARGLGSVVVTDSGRAAVVMNSEQRSAPVTGTAPGTAPSLRSQEFAMDGVFDQAASQDEVYSATVHPLVADLFTGRSFTLATYGMTGSGK